MRSSKHQTRASTDTRSLATAFIGGRVSSVCSLAVLKRKRGGCACGAGQRAWRVAPVYNIDYTSPSGTPNGTKMYAKLEHYRSTT
jgi:hypothetical protein